MLEWLVQNLATIVIGAVLLAAVILAVRSMVKTRKSGGCHCGCSDCKGCSCKGACSHKDA